MSDPSGESMALTDPFLMLLFPLGTQDAICLSWVSPCFMDVCGRLWVWKSGHKLRQPCPAAKQGPVTAAQAWGLFETVMGKSKWKKRQSHQDPAKCVAVKQSKSAHGATFELWNSNGFFMELRINWTERFDEIHPERIFRMVQMIKTTELNKIISTGLSNPLWANCIYIQRQKESYKKMKKIVFPPLHSPEKKIFIVFEAEGTSSWFRCHCQIPGKNRTQDLSLSFYHIISSSSPLI